MQIPGRRCTSRCIVGLACLGLLLAGGTGLRAEDAPAAPAEAPVDALAQALDAMGIGVEDLGYRPKAHWAAYPHPRTTPHVLPFFEDLLAHPLDTYPFVRSLADRAEDLLTPKALTTPPSGKNRREILFRLGVFLGTDRFMGGFRGYSCNLDNRPDDQRPLFHALRLVLERSGFPLRQEGSFGGSYQNGISLPATKLQAKVDAVPSAWRAPLARYLLDLMDAQRWIERGLRHVTPEQRQAVFHAIPGLAESTPDGNGYQPVFDDVATRVDKGSLYYGCLKALQATQDARRVLGALPHPDAASGDDAPAPWALHVRTGWGDIRVGAVEGVRPHEDADWLRLAFNEGQTRGRLGATNAVRSLSVALLLPTPLAEDEEVVPAWLDTPAYPVALAQGVLGCGLVYSAERRDNRWASRSWSQGCGCFGMGVLVDEGGEDLYLLDEMGQGAGYFGIGLLLDAAGNDRYRLAKGDGQGFGGPGGVGVLADRSGDDHYRAEPDASKAGRADYHSKHEVAVSNAQGVGSGRRGDGSDGHNWAGGLGALLDVDGNDHYEAGNFSQGLGYWYGTGLLWDGGGDDRYHSVYFTQGSGAHFAIGALIDEGGNDEHKLGHNAGAAYGFGWDVVNAFLIDRGTGNDRYEAKIISTGLAEVRSNAFFVDEGGDDVYILDAGTKGYGDVDSRPQYTTPRRGAYFPFELAQVGIFLDLGGTDRYLRRAKDGTTSPDPKAQDGGRWHVRAKDPAAPHGANVSVGMDLEGADLGWLRPWPRRKASNPEKAE